MKKILTLCIVHTPSRVLLGLKKRGFGEGRWNGFGGKVEAGETIEEAARREVKEEAGIELLDMEKQGIVDFSFEGKPGILEVHIFSTKAFSGEPKETEEMRPQWFSIKEIPFSTMWPDDVYWFPLFLQGKKFRGKFHFGENDAVLHNELHETELL